LLPDLATGILSGLAACGVSIDKELVLAMMGFDADLLPGILMGC
jgi:hypothetical protein